MRGRADTAASDHPQRGFEELGAACFAAVAIGSFLVPTALGGNVSRLGQYVAGPLLACALLPRRRLVLVALAIPLLIWQWIPAVDGIAFARTDPSTRQAYYEPLLDYLHTQSGLPGRVEPTALRRGSAGTRGCCRADRA